MFFQCLHPTVQLAAECAETRHAFFQLSQELLAISEILRRGDGTLGALAYPLDLCRHLAKVSDPVPEVLHLRLHFGKPLARRCLRLASTLHLGASGTESLGRITHRVGRSLQLGDIA